jgi:hypothetical protein
MVLGAVVLCASWGTLTGSGPAEEVVAPAARTPVLVVVPFVARNGASQYVARSLSDVFQAVLGEDPRGFQVARFEVLSTRDGETLVPVLARCTEVRCALELGQRLGADQVVVGVLDGPGDAAMLTIWRVAVEAGTVVGMYAQVLDPARLNQVTSQPSQVVEAVLSPVTPEPAAVSQAPVGSGLVTVPVVRSEARPRTALDHLRPQEPLGVAVRVASSVGLGAGAAGTVSALGLLALYATLAAYDWTSALDGRHVVAHPVAVALDTGLVLLLLTGWVPAVVAVGSGVVLGLTFAVPRE